MIAKTTEPGARVLESLSVGHGIDAIHHSDSLMAFALHCDHMFEPYCARAYNGTQDDGTIPILRPLAHPRMRRFMPAYQFRVAELRQLTVTRKRDTIDARIRFADIIIGDLT